MMKVYFPIILLFIACLQNGIAQESINPNSKVHQFKMEAFSAIYEQGGSSLHVETRLSADDQIYTVLMSMPNLQEPSKTITDVIGLHASTGAFFYRDFHTLMPSWSYNRVQHKAGKLVLQILDENGIKNKDLTSKQAVFDGTFLYWQLGSMNTDLENFSLYRWKTSKGAIDIGPTPEFNLTKKEYLKVGNKKYACKVFEVSPGPGLSIRSFVAKEAPYLIKQEYQQEGNPPTTILELKSIQ